jgi:lysozyme
MIPSDNCRSIIKKFEGLRLVPYICPAGKWTVGYGHRLYPDEQVKDLVFNPRTSSWHGVINDVTCQALLTSDMQKAARSVNLAVQVPLSQNQFDALVSFVLNIGGTAFANSTLCHLLNQKQFLNASKQFERWCHDDHMHVLPGLEARRKMERDLFLKQA